MRKNRSKNNGLLEIIIFGAIVYFAKDIINFGKSENYKIIIYIFIAAALIAIAALTFTKVKAAIKKANKRKYYLTSSIGRIDRMTGAQFEEYLCEHFKKHGYSVKLTPQTNDYGADLVIEKGSVKTVVQAKRYNTKVSNKAIQEIVGAMGYYKANNAMVITNSFFTKNAYALASANGVELWDRNKLIEIFSVKN